MLSTNQISSKIAELLHEFGDVDPDAVKANTALIGPGAIIKSRVIVELLLALEEYSEDELGAEFDWTSDSAVSIERSIFRTVGTLADHLHGLQSPQ